jgi:hypothetical protein
MKCDKCKSEITDVGLVGPRLVCDRNSMGSCVGGSLPVGSGYSHGVRPAGSPALNNCFILSTGADAETVGTIYDLGELTNVDAKVLFRNGEAWITAADGQRYHCTGVRRVL